MDLNAEIFWSTLIGAVIGGLIPFFVTLAWSPARARRERRSVLFVDLVPAGVAKAKGWRDTSGHSQLNELIQAVSDIYPQAALAGREDRRVLAAVQGALSAARAWLGGPREPAMQQMHAKVLGTYISEELQGYHRWLEHSLGRNPIARRWERQTTRLSEEWAVEGRRYIDEAPS